ncbi:ABC transporter ATP-binding protein [Paracoccus sulfuroxidans]|uniref:ATP-binding cassette subfamily B protein n=1 Tax=Paracoccus sulfuroxidans TaxID=384678 RepID=A0A562NLC1_9RHOB|nr:ABC transporter ATP-binding protein [Paracoccus sulfuroxidans]TWI32923.1 ATP-binding cassette subfamily B protein [Paracoccus sulfuroxidans]
MRPPAEPPTAEPRREALARRLARLIFDAKNTGWLAPVLAASLPAISLVLLTSLMAAAMGLALPLLTKQVIDQGIMARDMGALVNWSALSFLLGLASVGLGILNGMIHLRASARMLMDLRARVHDAAMRRDPAHPEMPLGEAMARLDGDSGEIQRFAFDTVLVAIGAIFRLVGGIVLMAMLDWRMVLLPLLIAPIELAFLSVARPKTQALAEEVRDQRGALSSTLAENLATRATLTAVGGMPAREGLFQQQQDTQITGLIRQRLWSETVGAVSQILSALTRAAILLIGGWLVVQGQWQLGTLIAYLAYATMMQGPLRNLLGLYHAQARSKVAVARLAQVFADARPDAGNTPPHAPQVLELIGLRAAGARHQPVDATLPMGARVLIDGPSGIGKTRLLSALTRAAPVEAGQALLDGAAIDAMQPSALCALILHLPQRPGILRGTIAMNLRLAAPDADEATMWLALEQADLAAWARSKAGLETDLAETGADLSGGMRQRLSLARAFLSRSPILIFDESFSEIDEPSTRRILQAIDAAFADRLRIFTAHNGPVREQAFDQRITLSSIAPLRRISSGDSPNQRENAREKAV